MSASATIAPPLRGKPSTQFAIHDEGSDKSASPREPSSVSILCLHQDAYQLT